MSHTILQSAVKCLFEIPQVDAGESPKYLQHPLGLNWNEENRVSKLQSSLPF